MAVDDAAGYLPELRRLVGEAFLLDADQLGDTTPFAELGIDSKKRVRLLAVLEIHYGVSIELDERDRLTDLAAVAGVLVDALRVKPPADSR